MGWTVGCQWEDGTHTRTLTLALAQSGTHSGRHRLEMGLADGTSCSPDALGTV